MKSIKKLVRILVLPTVSALLITACSNGANKTEAMAKDTMTVTKDTSNIFEHMLVDNLKDPSCGMPVTAGINDTAHYKDKVLGFCSTECKDEFKKDPDALIAAAEIKK